MFRFENSFGPVKGFLGQVVAGLAFVGIVTVLAWRGNPHRGHAARLEFNMPSLTRVQAEKVQSKPNAKAAEPVVPRPATQAAAAKPDLASESSASRAAALLPEPSPVEAKICRALAEPLEMEFNETALSDVAAYLKQALRIEIALDTRAMEDASLGPDALVTLHCKDLTAKAGLEMMLDRLELEWTIHHDVLWITTPERSRSLLSVKVYRVTELVDSDAASLIEVITTAVAPATWHEVGGSGNIHEFACGDVELLVISQTRQVHDQVAALLTQLRAAMSVPEKEDAPIAPAAGAVPKLRARVRDPFDSPRQGVAIRHRKVQADDPFESREPRTAD